MSAPILLVVGLKREAALLAGPGVDIVVGGGAASTLLPALEARLGRGRPRAVVSVGLAGALSPELEVGDWVVADRVADCGRSWPADRRLRDELGAAEPWAGQGYGRRHVGAIAGSEVMVATVADKTALHAATGALAVDMESRHAARFATDHGLPFAALRVVSDAAGHSLPPAAQAGMKTDGGVDILAVVRELAIDPRQLPALLRTGREAEVAFGRLKLLGRDHLLGRLGIGDADLGQLPLDMV